MKKKYFMAGLTCIFLLITGICYSCAYRDQSAAVFHEPVEESSGTELLQTTSEENTTKNMAVQVQTSEVTSSATQSVDGFNASSDSGTGQDSTELTQSNTNIYVHICGAVKNPGVYAAASGARLIDFIRLAGGLTRNAAGDYINQAQSMSDGQRIYIPDQEVLKNLSPEEYRTGVAVSTMNDSSISKEESAETALININTADMEELMSISGIGEAKAKSIIAYREKNGSFASIEELMKIPGIKEGLFNQISYMIVAK